MASKGNSGSGAGNTDWSPQDDYQIYLNSVMSGTNVSNYTDSMIRSDFTQVSKDMRQDIERLKNYADGLNRIQHSLTEYESELSKRYSENIQNAIEHAEELVKTLNTRKRINNNSLQEIRRYVREYERAEQSYYNAMAELM